MQLYAIVLAGGYAKRLWPLTLNKPKPLLPIAGKPILDHIMEKLEALQPPLSRIVLSTNMRFQPQYEQWLHTSPYSNIELVPDATASETEKLGAIKAMANIIAANPEDDVLVIAGDGMFRDDLTGMMKVFQEKKATVVALYVIKSLEEAKRCATANTNKQGKLTELTEKPQAPKTTVVCGAVYIFQRGVSSRIKQYLASGLSTDAPGRFIEWLYKQEPVYTYMLKDPLWDIGTKEAYQACDQCFGSFITQQKA